MFVYQPNLKALPCEPEDILKVYRGMNMVKVSVGEFVSEPCETYIVTSRVGPAPVASRGAAKPAPPAATLLQTHLVFYLEAPAVRAVWSYDANPFPPERRVAVEAEANEMAEQMGAILEDSGWETMAPAARVQWLAQEYLFRTGAPRPRPGAKQGPATMPPPPREATREAPPARPAPPEVIPAVPPEGEPKGMETSFDELLDSAFFEGAEPKAQPAKAPVVVRLPDEVPHTPPPAPARPAAAAPSRAPEPARPKAPEPPPPKAPEPPPPRAPEPQRAAPAADLVAQRTLRFLAGF